ncbi:undecaprenyldiphospho-muramoylpentapeptide beta-N-acetylglucosaminyltransferase [Helicobacter kayseriensis]|uniref:undecaprenyldiphospho-muramoylpentapeptide beta-N-acetylglucosaminyltransferase n=1 Tax=Helicobacter kayseriensis TaxID=2905877 RepID=UPI001E2AFD38|nr:undecaprenyldiphospho-muramoylpentapeptide beta-N-acetylglucosaminyltransferase [Helicobacter kayseriensis]MCE3047401.1 undecaprenyldiphospho-muramoylpentapeptide beta-N-acetylglucosaminyltransferase [Helicobacter kayseriensis]MCE3048928.1 undecaprenyldiphospho-muramoylpentapeptide beta-N-acetylglucosaminyltransferase [Helicobacter kayseriensis]
MPTCIAISGGGTGGHLAIAKALMLECQKNNIPCIYIGSTSGQDQLWFENEKNFQATYFFHTKGVVNQKGLGIFKTLYFQLRAFLQAKKILKSHQVSCVFSVGGYSSAPASFAAIWLKIPLFIHEQNAVKGALNKLLSPFAKTLFGSFKDKHKNFIQTSYPVRDIFFESARIRKEIRCVLFLGGSQGAVAINDFALKIAPLLHQSGIKIIHQSGERDYERLKQAYEKLQIPITLFSFSKDLVSYMHQTDLCFTRSGASSVWEMCANALPCVYIPYPYAAGDHQYFNALFFTQKSLGILCPQDKLSEKIIDQIQDLNLSFISKQLTQEIKQGGAQEILESILNTLKEIQK